MSVASHPPPLRVGVWHRAAAAALVAGLVGLQVRAMLGPHEDWPFTSAPMFARYHTADDPLFELRVIARLADGSEREIVPQRDLGVGELAFRRQLFSKHYGSVDPRHPSGHRDDDTRGSFEKRLGEWLGRVARVYERNTGRSLKGVRLEVRRVSAGDAKVRQIADVSLERGLPSD